MLSIIYYKEKLTCTYPYNYERRELKINQSRKRFANYSYLAIHYISLQPFRILLYDQHSNESKIIHSVQTNK